MRIASLFYARGAPPPRALARRPGASLGPQALFVCFAVGLCAPAYAESPAPAASWGRFDVQTATVSTRYRFIENSSRDVTTNQVQFKDTARIRVKLDEGGRFAVTGGWLTGNTFTGSWDNTGIGTGDLAGTQALRHLFVSAAAAPGLELQMGGLYINHGESTEITSYDDDGYLIGERLTLRRPAQAYFDEVSVTRAGLSPLSSPGVVRRLSLLGHQHYWQAQVVKRYGSSISASADFTDEAGAETLRAAVAVRFPKGAPVSALRYEQYRRVTMQPASGFAVSVERRIARVRLQAGYSGVDAEYGGLNADRFQRGRRVFAMAAIPISGPLSAQLFATQAFTSPYSISNRRRLDAVVTYDLLAALGRHRAN
jgi:hypothetical protein